MGGKARDLAKAFRELVDFGAVELGMAQDALKVKRYAEAMGMVVGLVGRPGLWKVYDLSQMIGEVV